jgi:RNA exonuclease 4
MAKQYNKSKNNKSYRTYKKSETKGGSNKLYDFIGGITATVNNANEVGKEHRYDQSLDNSYGRTNINNYSKMQNERRSAFKVGKYVAVDCEFVGTGYKGSKSELGRVSLVNYHGNVIYDTYVKPAKPVTDYRTKYSGLRPQDIKNGVSFETARKQVDDIINGRILVGHSIQNDLSVLQLHHNDIRDTSQLPEYKQLNGGQKPSLKFLSENVLNKKIQSGEHSSVEDAAATMELYKAKKQTFEEFHRSK